MTDAYKYEILPHKEEVNVHLLVDESLISASPELKRLSRGHIELRDDNLSIPNNWDMPIVLMHSTCIPLNQDLTDVLQNETLGRGYDLNAICGLQSVRESFSRYRIVDAQDLWLAEYRRPTRGKNSSVVIPVPEGATVERYEKPEEYESGITATKGDGHVSWSDINLVGNSPREFLDLRKVGVIKNVSWQSLACYKTESSPLYHFPFLTKPSEEDLAKALETLKSKSP